MNETIDIEVERPTFAEFIKICPEVQENVGSFSFGTSPGCYELLHRLIRLRGASSL